MKLHTRVTHALLAEEDHLALHLSEPNFTFWQRMWHKVRLGWAYTIAWVR